MMLLLKSDYARLVSRAIANRKPGGLADQVARMKMQFLLPVHGKTWKPPTPAQAEAGNYYKPSVNWNGMTIKVENPAGSVRKWDGGQTLMQYDYGYIRGTDGVDGDEVDVYLGPSLNFAPMVYVVHQRRAGDWEKYDEDKAMLGFLSEDQARDAYLKQYDDPRFLGAITAMPVDEFVAKVKATKDNPMMIKAQRRAHKGGEVGANGEFYEGGKFIATTDHAKGKPKLKGGGRQEIEPYKWEMPPEPGMRSLWRAIGPGVFVGLDRATGKWGLIASDTTWGYYFDHDANLIARAKAHYLNMIARFEAGERWIKPEEAMIKAHVHAYARHDGTTVRDHEDRRPNRKKRYPDRTSPEAAAALDALKAVRRGALREAVGPKLDSYLAAIHASNEHVRSLVERAGQPAESVAEATLDALAGMDTKRLVRVHGWSDLIGFIRSALRDLSVALRQAKMDKAADWLQWQAGEWTDDDLGRLLLRADKRAGILSKGNDMADITRRLGDFGQTPVAVLFLKSYVKPTSYVMNGKTVQRRGYTDKRSKKLEGGGKDPYTGDLFDGDKPTESAHAEGDKWVMPIKDAIAEHKDLVHAAETPSRADDKEELKEQKGELKRMEASDTDDDHPAPIPRRTIAGLSDSDRAKWIEHHRAQHELTYYEMPQIRKKMEKVRHLKNLAESEMRQQEAHDKELRGSGLPGSIERADQHKDAADRMRIERKGHADELGRLAEVHQGLYEHAGKHARAKHALLPESDDLRLDMMSGKRRDDAEEKKYATDAMKRYRAYYKGKTSMAKSIPILFLKTHVTGYTRADGVTVKPHEDKRAKPAEKDWRDEENWHTRTMARMKTLPDASLRYIIKYANEAAANIEEMHRGSQFEHPKAGRYRDEAHYAAMELRRRQDGSK